MILPIRLTKVDELTELAGHLFYSEKVAALKDFGLEEGHLAYLDGAVETSTFASVNKYPQVVGVIKNNSAKSKTILLERLRNDGAKAAKMFENERQTKLALFDLVNDADAVLAILEGIVAASYRFTKYKTQKEKLGTVLDTIMVVSPSVSQQQLDELSAVWAANWLVRDLVNETPAHLTAEKLAAAAVQCGAQTGFKTKVFGKEQIEMLGFGGLLAVNRGSVNAPTFTVMEWKPANAANLKPIVLVGKGIVYDTGGINLKTAAGSLDDMKCDMAGAAAVIGAMTAIAQNNLPVHVVGLVPATDNRPGFNAYVPGDVITMHSGATVEVMNTDAEGRLILADALSYAKDLDPLLVIDLATLTGNAVMAIGPYGTVAMGTAEGATVDSLTVCADYCGERLAWFPFWDEYDELLKSDVADMKNIGGREAGAITAGKFLARFTDYPWVHLDIAGPAFLAKPLGYRSVGATGVGVRLLYRFVKEMAGKE